MKTPDGSFTPSLILAAVLLILCVGVISFLRDPDFSPRRVEEDSTLLEAENLAE